MTPTVLERDEVAVNAVQPVPQGCSVNVVPSAEFARVELDSAFTGSASRGGSAPYFSQMDNLNSLVSLYAHYAPPPVRNRVLHVRVGVIRIDVPSATQMVTSAPRTAPAPPAGVDAAPQMRLSELTEQMRDLVDLPVQDLARMCGIGRRQYYNLLGGKAETMKTLDGEKWLRLVHKYLSDLHSRLGSPAAVRAAVLMPLGKQGMSSLMDIAGSQDMTALQSAYEELSAELNSGVTPSPNALPPSGKLPAGDDSWTEAGAFLRDYRPTGE